MKQAIGFMNGNFYLRQGKSYLCMNKEHYLPLVQEKLNQILQLPLQPFPHISKLIFDTLKDVFQVTSTFYCYYSGSQKIGYNQDSLYNELEKYIQNNENYKKELEKLIHTRMERLQKAKEQQAKERPYVDYCKKCRLDSYDQFIIKKKRLNTF